MQFTSSLLSNIWGYSILTWNTTWWGKVCLIQRTLYSVSDSVSSIGRLLDLNKLPRFANSGTLLSCSENTTHHTISLINFLSVRYCHQTVGTIAQESKAWQPNILARSIFFIQLNNINNKNNKLLPPYVNSLVTRWHITGHPTASNLMKPYGQTFRRGCWTIGPCCPE